ETDHIHVYRCQKPEILGTFDTFPKETGECAVALYDLGMPGTSVCQQGEPCRKRPKATGVFRCVVKVIRTQVVTAKIGGLILENFSLQHLVTGKVHGRVVR